MHQTLRELAVFISASVRHWGVLVTGGVLVASVVVYEHVTGRAISGSFFWGAIGASLFAAFFLAWRDERRKLQILEAQINAAEKIKQIGDKLSDLYDDGRTIRRKIVDSDDGFTVEMTVQCLDDWREELFDYLRDNVSLSKARHTVDIESVQAASIGGMKSVETRERKNTLLLYHTERLSRLGELMKRY